MKKTILSVVIFALLSSCGIASNASAPTPTTVQKYLAPTSTQVGQSIIPMPSPVSIHTQEPKFTRNGEVISADNIKQLKLIDHWGKGSVYDFDISPDEKTLALISATGVYLYDIHTQELKEIISQQIGFDNYNPWGMGAIAYSPDGNYLAIGYNDIKIWNIAKRIIEHRIFHIIGDFPMIRLAFSADGKQIVSLGVASPTEWAFGDGNLFVFDTETGKTLFSKFFIGYTRNINMTDNGVLYLSTGNSSAKDGGKSFETTLVDVKTGNVIESFTSDDFYLYDLSSDGLFAASWLPMPKNGNTDIYNMKTHELIKKYSGSFAFIANTNKAIYQNKIINSPLASDIAKPTFEDFNGNVDCTFTFDDEYLHTIIWLERKHVVRGNTLAAGISPTNEIGIWDISSCKKIASFALGADASSHYSSVSYSPDGESLAVDTYERLWIWESTTGRIRTIFSKWGENYVGSDGFFAYSPDGKLMLVKNADKQTTLRLVDMISGVTIKNNIPGGERIENLAISSDGRKIAKQDGNGLSVFDLYSGEVIYSLPADYDISQIKFGSDKTKLALMHRGTEQGELVIIDLMTKQIDKKYLFPFSNASLSPDWNYLSSVKDGEAYLWDINKGTTTKIKLSNKKIGDKPCKIKQLIFSPNGQILAIVYEDGSISFLEVSSSKMLGEVVPKNKISLIDFNPDNTRIAMVGEDGTIQIWGVK